MKRRKLTKEERRSQREKPTLRIDDSSEEERLITREDLDALLEHFGINKNLPH